MPEASNSRSLKNAANWIIIISGILIFLIYFKSLLQPLAVALIVWFLINQLKDYIGKISFRNKRIPKPLRTLISILLIFATFYFIGDLLVTSLNQIIERIPQYELKQDKIIAQINEYIQRDEITDKIDGWIESIEIRPILSGIVNSLSSTLGNTVIIIVYIVFLLLEESLFSKKLKMLTVHSPGDQDFGEIWGKVHDAISSYVNIKTLISLFTGVLSYVVMLIIGVDFPVLWAFVIFLFNFIPYVGSFVATFIPAIFAVVQFGSLWYFVYVFAAVEAVQIFVGNYVEPKMMGRSLNLSPLVVMVTLTFWGIIWGILGMILSVPIVSVLTIILAQFPSTRKVAILLSETGDIESYLISKGSKNKEE